jgi:hypothetical protein
MTTDDTDDETLETLAEYLRLNPDATTPEVLGATDTDPSVWADVVEDALATDDSHLALEAPDTDAPEGGSRDETSPSRRTNRPRKRPIRPIPTVRRSSTRWSGSTNS